MYNLENYLYNDRNKGISDGYFKTQAKYCAEIRELIAKVLMHLILFYLDEDVHKNLPNFPVRLDLTDFK